jgi:hypothetical protein
MMRAVYTDQLRPWGRHNSKLWHVSVVINGFYPITGAEHLLLQLATLALVSTVVINNFLLPPVLFIE